MRSNRLTGAAARSRLKRCHSWRTKTPSATTTQRVKTTAGSMTLPLNLRLRAMQPRAAIALLALAAGRGMLFVFPAEAPHEFWMKNTFIPLDMIFIAGDGHIAGIQANTTPLSTAPLGVDGPSRYVLEVPGGWAARRGVAPGDHVEL